MIRPFLFLGGYCRLSFPRQWAAEILNFCGSAGLIYRSPEFSEEEFTLLCSRATAKRLEAVYAVTKKEEFGFPSVLGRYRCRPGIWIGLLLSILLIWGSGQVIWQIQIIGNEQVSDKEVLEQLALCGMEVGDSIASLDTAVLENRMLIESDTISWISINLLGTVAEVEVREVLPEPEEAYYDAANLVASRSGVIQWLEDTRGNVAVQVGDVVGEGDLLVGGLYSPEGGGLRYTVAKGKVVAKTERSFDVTIPLTYEQKVYTGEVKVEKYLIFFKKEIKFFGNTGNLYERCDTIDTVEYFEMPGQVSLPVGIRTVRYLEYDLEETTRDEETVIRLAYEKLRLQMEGTVSEGMLLRKQLTENWETDTFLLHCRAEYLENIAQTKEIKIDGTKNRKN
ncbi:MAG: sporulation protein YqfD [Clostridia bacterium]|nr:sporulation protein YqfD [Clostridia bacterium]